MVLVQFLRQILPIGGMVATLKLLHQYRLAHLQVCLPQAKKRLAFLHCPAEVSKMFGPGTGRECLGEEISLDGIDTDMASIMFRVLRPKHACKGSQSFLPRNHGTLSAI
jgi:hypothetical protein